MLSKLQAGGTLSLSQVKFESRDFECKNGPLP